MSTPVFVIYILVLIYTWLIVARAVLSWFRLRPGSPVYQVKRVLFVVTEPYLRLLRRVLPVARFGWPAGLDLSTLLGLIILFVIIQVLARI